VPVHFQPDMVEGYPAHIAHRDRAPRRDHVIIGLVAA
jgi:hypothetical protein